MAIWNQVEALSLTSPHPRMDTALSRCHALVAYAFGILAILTFVCFVTTASPFRNYSAVADIKTVRVLVRNAPDYSGGGENADLAFLTFDLKADFRPLFNWNVKELFLYLTAEYETSANKVNQVVIWDKIIMRGENALLDHQNMRPTYYFWDDGSELRGNKNVTLTLYWNVIPNAGRLPMLKGKGHQFKFADEYSTKM